MESGDSLAKGECILIVEGSWGDDPTEIRITSGCASHLGGCSTIRSWWRMVHVYMCEGKVRGWVFPDLSQQSKQLCSRPEGRASATW